MDTDSKGSHSRPLLLLVGKGKQANEDVNEVSWNFLDLISRPKTSAVFKQKEVPITKRSNPLISMLDDTLTNSKQSNINSSSFQSFSTANGSESRESNNIKVGRKHTKSALDAYYRIALQNQTAFKPVEKVEIEQRKLHDKHFASQHRALKGSLRSATILQ